MQVWNSHLEKDIHRLEKFQKFALQICIKDNHETYENLLRFFKGSITSEQEVLFVFMYVLLY